jgi:hypothetical protein
MWTRSEPQTAPPAQTPRSEARDADVFTPSTFASRSAAPRPQPRGQQIVSLGMTEIRYPAVGGRAPEIREVEMGVDLRCPSEFFVRQGNRWVPAAPPAIKDDVAVPLGTVRRRETTAVTFPAASSDTVRPA